MSADILEAAAFYLFMFFRSDLFRIRYFMSEPFDFYARIGFIASASLSF